MYGFLLEVAFSALEGVSHEPSQLADNGISWKDSGLENEERIGHEGHRVFLKISCSSFTGSLPVL